MYLRLQVFKVYAWLYSYLYALLFLSWDLDGSPSAWELSSDVSIHQQSFTLLTLPCASCGYQLYSSIHSFLSEPNRAQLNTVGSNVCLLCYWTQFTLRWIVEDCLNWTKQWIHTRMDCSLCANDQYYLVNSGKESCNQHHLHYDVDPKTKMADQLYVPL